MFERILCGIDSPGSQEAARLAARLAKDMNAELVLVHAWYSPPASSIDDFVLPAETMTSLIEESKRSLSAACDAARGAGVTRVSSRFVIGVPWAEIVETARDAHADLIVVGTHGRTGVSRFFLGSVAEKVVRHAPCSVLVTRGEPTAFARILCPVDFSASSREAMERAATLPATSITLLHAIDLPLWYGGDPRSAVLFEDLDKRAHARLDAWSHELEARTTATVSRKARVGGGASQILSVLDDDGSYDLVVVGSHGRTGIRRILLGSVAERVVRHARCSVLVARSSAHTE
jgi:nucleotide-binding universal stress UspA family protein